MIAAITASAIAAHGVPADLADTVPAPPVSLLVTSSRIGEKTYPGTMAFLRLIHPPMQGYSLLLAQGGHNFGTWQRELPQSLAWLGRRLRPAVPDQPQQVLLHS